jgi:mannose-6-phosphate isomerase-like protein (cupin superfamily)
MAEIHQDISQFSAERAWGARDLAEIAGATVRLHWTDQPYIWHVNDGAEVFVVLDGAVEMKYRLNGAEHSVRLGPTDVFVADVGDEHVAHPIGAARILVVERKGSV